MHREKRWLIRSLALISVFTCFCACKACGNDPKLVPAEMDQMEEGVVKLMIGDEKVFLEIAETVDKRTKGFMYRNSLAQDRGMIFIYPEPKLMSFWMKNVKFPLSIAFLKEDGRIINIEEMKPGVEKPGYTSKGFCNYAIEMNKGWFAKNGIKAGDNIELTEKILAIKGEPDV